MKAKSFYKNNKHNNMDSKEKENINEEELKAQDAQDETCEETTEKEEEAALTEEEKLAQELEKANAEIEDQKDKYLRLSAEFDNYRKRTMKEKAELILNGGEKSISSIRAPGCSARCSGKVSCDERTRPTVSDTM